MKKSLFIQHKKVCLDITILSSIRFKTSIIASTKSQFSSFFSSMPTVILIFSNCPLKFFFWQNDAEIPRLQCYHLSTPFVMLFNDKIIVSLPPAPPSRCPSFHLTRLSSPTIAQTPLIATTRLTLSHIYIQAHEMSQEEEKKSHFLCSHPKHIFYDLLYTLTWNFHTGSYHP